METHPAREPTIEWQVCGVCNYDCSYCIQSKKSRVGHPSADEVERFLDFYASLPGTWEIKMSGGEPFAFRGFMERIIPGLVERTSHTVSVLTNLSAPRGILSRFASLTRGRLGIVSTSIHLEHVDIDEFVDKARAFRAELDPKAKMVVNAVLVPGRLERVDAARKAIEGAGLRFFPQIMKIKGGIFDYDEEDRPRLDALVGLRRSPREVNLAPSYKGRLCWAGVDYLVVTQRGEAYSCRTAKRFHEGFLGNVLDGSFSRMKAPERCTYDICPCTVPANRGMIEGVGVAADAQGEA